VENDLQLRGGDRLSLRHPVVDVTRVRKTVRERKHIHFIREGNRAQDIHETNRREKKNLFKGDSKKTKVQRWGKDRRRTWRTCFYFKRERKSAQFVSQKSEKFFPQEKKIIRACKRKTRAKDKNARELFHSARNAFRKRGRMLSLQKQGDSEVSFLQKGGNACNGGKKEKTGRKRERARAIYFAREVK